MHFPHFVLLRRKKSDVGFRLPRVPIDALRIMVEASERRSFFLIESALSLAFKLLLSGGVMGEYMGGRNWPPSVAWTSTSHSGIPKFFHRSTVSSKTSFRLFSDVRCKLLAFSNSALSILHLSRCSCNSFSSWETFKLCKYKCARCSRCSWNQHQFLCNGCIMACWPQATSTSADCERSTLSWPRLSDKQQSSSLAAWALPGIHMQKSSNSAACGFQAKLASGNFGTSSDKSILDKVDALEPSDGIFSGSTSEVSEAIGLFQWCCLAICIH